jgi:hypothetical protein
MVPGPGVRGRSTLGLENLLDLSTINYDYFVRHEGMLALDLTARNRAI